MNIVPSFIKNNDNVNDCGTYWERYCSVFTEQQKTLHRWCFAIKCCLATYAPERFHFSIDRYHSTFICKIMFQLHSLCSACHRNNEQTFLLPTIEWENEMSLTIILKCSWSRKMSIHGLTVVFGNRNSVPLLLWDLLLRDLLLRPLVGENSFRRIWLARPPEVVNFNEMKFFSSKVFLHSEFTKVLNNVLEIINNHWDWNKLRSSTKCWQNSFHHYCTTVEIALKLSFTTESYYKFIIMWPLLKALC